MSISFAAVLPNVAQLDDPEIIWVDTLFEAHSRCAIMARQLPAYSVRVFSKQDRGAEKPEYQYLGNQHNLPVELR